MTTQDSMATSRSMFLCILVYLASLILGFYGTFSNPKQLDLRSTQLYTLYTYAELTVSIAVFGGLLLLAVCSSLWISWRQQLLSGVVGMFSLIIGSLILISLYLGEIADSDEYHFGLWLMSYGVMLMLTAAIFTARKWWSRSAPASPPNSVGS